MNRLKHWQVFLLFFLPIFIALHLDTEIYKTLLMSVALLVIVIYYLMIGEFLDDPKVKGHLLFRFNCVFLTVSFLTISNHLLESVTDNVIIGFVILTYTLIALIQVIDHVAVLIRQREGKDVNDYKQKAEFTLLFFWPIGIWFLQPRINRME